MESFSHEPLWMWLVFIGLVFGLLMLDLGVFHRKQHAISVKESLWTSAFYIAVGLLFGGWVWWNLGDEKGMEYLTGYVVEKTLAMDNIFVIAIIFSYFSIPQKFQHRVLFWGILGVLILRGIMIGLGAALVTEFHWILYIFGAFLVFTGVKMLLMDDHAENDISNNMVLKFMRGHFRITEKLHEEKFIVRDQGKWFLTPLMVTLVMIEIADVVFAVDSIPAIFAITLDPYIVYTSNIFAILGLRALYFALAAMIERFSYLKYALSIVLIFIGGKIFAVDFLGLEKIPPLVSLSITVAILACGFFYSLWKTRKSA